MKMKPILCVDFDGVLHSYSSGWQGVGNIKDPPVPGAGLFLLRAIPVFRVAVYSSRSKSLRGRFAMRRWLRQVLWDACLENRAAALAAWTSATGHPSEWNPWTAYDVRDQADDIGRVILWPWFKPQASVTPDDRAICFTGEWPTIEELRGFKPWNKRLNSI